MLKPGLNYEAYHENRTGEFHFMGVFESLSDDNLLWVRNDDLTIPVDIENSRAYILPDNPDEALPEKIRWNRFSILTGEAKVYVGGKITIRNNRPVFVSGTGNPLQIIFYEGSDSDLSVRITRSGRYKNKYWNFVTPYAHIAGAFSQIIMSVYLFDRPARRLAMITAFIAFFAPLIPFIPPGILFSLFYRRLWWRARLYRVYRDLVSYPLFYIPKNETSGRLYDGSIYGKKQFDTLPDFFYEKNFPFIIPETEKKKKDKWFVFGIAGKEQDENVFSAPKDPLVVYGAIPGEPKKLARLYSWKGWAYEILSWIIVGIGIGVNLFFIRAILLLTGVFSGLP